MQFEKVTVSFKDQDQKYSVDFGSHPLLLASSCKLETKTDFS